MEHLPAKIYHVLLLGGCGAGPICRDTSAKRTGPLRAEAGKPTAPNLSRANHIARGPVVSTRREQRFFATPGSDPTATSPAAIGNLHLTSRRDAQSLPTNVGKGSTPASNHRSKRASGGRQGASASGESGDALETTQNGNGEGLSKGWRGFAFGDAPAWDRRGPASRPDTPKTSEATLASLILAVSRSLRSRLRSAAWLSTSLRR